MASEHNSHQQVVQSSGELNLLWLTNQNLQFKKHLKTPLKFNGLHDSLNEK